MDYQRWERRERRKRVVWAIAAWAFVLGSAALMVVTFWAAFVGLCVLFG